MASNGPQDGLPYSLVSYVFLAEFNIDEGSVLKYEYPTKSGVDEHLLAEHMLPDGVHDRAEDWTIFYLNQIAPLTVKEEAQGQRDGSELLHVMSLVRTKKIATVRRGAMVKALAVASKEPFIQIFKPALLLALEEYFNSPSIQCLSKLYDSLNAIDHASIPRLSDTEKLILRTSDLKDLYVERFPALDREPGRHASTSSLRPLSSAGGDSNEELAERTERMSISSVGSVSSLRGDSSAEDLSGSLSHRSVNLSPEDAYFKRRQSSALRSMPKDTHWFDTSIAYGNIRLPLRLPMTTFPEEVGEYSLINLIQTFSSPNAIVPGPLHAHLHTNGAQTHPILLLFNALITNKRVAFLGHGQAAGKVANHVLAACALASGCGTVLKGFTERAFPYTNLTNLDNLQSIPGFIAGVCNPAFADRPSWWDVLLNIESGKVVVSKDIQPAAPASRNFNAASLKNVAPGESISAFSDDSDITKGTSPTENGAAPLGSAKQSDQSQQQQQQQQQRFESPDVAFMEEISTAIAAHYGEGIVRARFTDYVHRFVRLASKYEEEQFGRTSIGWPSATFSEGSLGSGMVFTEGQMARELALNASRIEGWRTSPSYAYLQTSWAKSRVSSPFKTFDLLHQLSRLRHSRKMPTAEVEAIMRTLVENVKSDEEVTALLACLPPHFGGLLPLAFGLFHPSEQVKRYTVELLETLDAHPTGSKVLQGLNAFHRSAFARLADAKRRSVPAPAVR